MSNFTKKEYRTVGGAPLSYIIDCGSSNDLIIFDEEKGYNRAIRHCPNEKSIYLDEQSDFAVIEPITFERGYLAVRPQDQHTQKFLDASPENKANGGSVFYEVVAEEEAKGSLVLDDLITDLKIIVRERADEAVNGDEEAFFDLQAVASTIQGSWVTVKDMPVSSLRRLINKSIEQTPMRYVKNERPEIFDVQSKRTYFALRALAANIIHTSADGRSLIWTDTKKVITAVPPSHTAQDYLIEFLSGEDGKIIIEKIVKALS